MEDNFEKELERVAETSAPEIDFEGLDLPADMAEQIRQIESLAQIDSEFANSQEYKDLMASISNSGQASKSNSEEEDEDEEYDEEEEEEDEEESVDSDDIFGILKSPKKEKEVKLSFEPPKEMVKMLSSKYGIEDASKFFASVDTWRNQAQEGSEIKREYEALTEDLQSLPADIRTQIQLWANGEDHTQFMNVQQRLDFSSDFDDQEIDGLVQHYLPEQYNKLTRSLENGDIDEADFEDRITLLAESTKRMFIEDKKALEAEREQFIERQKNQFQNLKKTALLSVENLSKAYPNFSKSEINKIRSVLVEGKIDSLFTKSDGTYNEDAAELVAYAMYGKKMLESVRKISERKGESKANQKIVDSSPKTVKKQKAAGGNQGLGMEAVGHLSGVFKGDPYASR
jgi:hypothetical protein